MSALTLPDDLRAITIRQPWASLIAHGVKTIETRGRRCNYRGPVAIHAAAKWTVDQFVDVVRSGTGPAIADALIDAGHAEPHTEPRVKGPYPGDVYYHSTELVHDLPLGAIVAVANLVDCIPTNVVYPWADDDEHMGGQPLPADAGWAWTEADEPRDGVLTTRREAAFGDLSNGRWALLLTGVTRLPEPVPAKGNQAVPWRVPADVAAQVRGQVDQ